MGRQTGGGSQVRVRNRQPGFQLMAYFEVIPLGFPSNAAHLVRSLGAPAFETARKGLIWHDLWLEPPLRNELLSPIRAVRRNACNLVLSGRAPACFPFTNVINVI
jgi:hypothetical protein